MNNLVQKQSYPNFELFSGEYKSRFNSTLLLEVKRGGRTYTSSAVVIGRNMLLTSAHSVDCIDEGSALLGNIKNSDNFIKMKNCIIHPEYNPGNSLYKNDIAIVILESNLPKSIKPETIERDINLLQGELLDRIGFGGRDKLNIRTWLKPSFDMTTFCCKNFILQDNKSVIGDSGGPIYKNVDGVLKLIGIHSTLEGKNKTYIVNVSKYIGWIESNKSLRAVN